MNRSSKAEEIDPEVVQAEVASTSQPSQRFPPKRTYWQSLTLFSGIHTQESTLKLFFRPVILLTLPPVLWATLMMSVTIGFLVAITSNFAVAFNTLYGFEAWQSGLCFIACPVGAGIGAFFGGRFSDIVADFLTRRNNGIRHPEMRLPAVSISLITAPLALVLYGVGIDKGLHWIVPTIGLGLCELTHDHEERQTLTDSIVNFSIVQATNISLVYTIDGYRPVAGELAVTQHAFKCEFNRCCVRTRCSVLTVTQLLSASFFHSIQTHGLPSQGIPMHLVPWQVFREALS